MNLHEQLNQAIKMATHFHSKQVDKAGEPYILHPLWVMNNVKTLKGKIVAVLHDVVEDTSVTIHKLNIYGFDKDIIEAVDVLTRKEDQKYSDYIELIATNEIAREVKIADLSHNMDLSRLKEVTNRDEIRYTKYLNARDYLINLSYE